LLSPLADMAIQLGKLAVATGIAISGIKKAFSSLNPAVAIAAGVALIVLGSAVKAGLSNIASGSSGGVSTALPSASAGSTRNLTGNLGDRANQNININIDGVLKGSNLHLAVKRYGEEANIKT
jgi:hypothetical protein